MFQLVDGTEINFIEVQVEFIVHNPLVCKARLVMVFAFYCKN